MHFLYLVTSDKDNHIAKLMKRVQTLEEEKEVDIDRMKSLRGTVPCQ